MPQRKIISLIFLLSVLAVSRSNSQWDMGDSDIIVGAARIDSYYPLLRGKSVGIVTNHTSLVGDEHLVDTLLRRNIRIKKIFSPEHGFRGDVEDGAMIDNSRDTRTKLPIISLYGNNKKPTEAQLTGIQVMILDLQDVGVRFYTYISTMQKVMEACAENQVPLIVLDRPNPNGDYVAGPVLDMRYASWVGLNPIPVVYGMTMGELAKMINGEGWLKSESGQKLFCRLDVILCEGYTHSSEYDPPIEPSPNLPNYESIRWYPSLSLFQGTSFSVGRGTPYPHLIYGHPEFKGDYSFTPQVIPGKSVNPPHLKQKCYGVDLRGLEPEKFTLKFVVEAFQEYDGTEKFFNSYFRKLIGNGTTEAMIKEGKGYEEIEKTWEADLYLFKQKRKKYLLYPD